MAPFVHLILTRFNLRWSWVRPDAAWMERRLDIFARYCFPAVASQTNQQFFWLVYFDAETQPEYRELVRRRFVDALPAFQPRYIASLSEIDLRAEIRQLLPREPEFLITTRLDNDDCLSYDAVQRIQQQFRRQSCAVVNFDTFYQYDFERITVKNIRSNNHLSLIEKIAADRPLVNTLQLNHTKVSALYPTVHIRSEAILVMLIHGQNLGTPASSGQALPPHELPSLRRHFLLFRDGLPSAGA